MARFLAFVAVSVALHAMPWLLWSDTGRQASGGAGAEAVTLEAAAPSLGALVAKWSEPVSAATQSVKLPPAEASDAPSAMPLRTSEPVQIEAPQVLVTPEEEQRFSAPAPPTRLSNLPMQEVVSLQPPSQSVDAEQPISRMQQPRTPGEPSRPVSLAAEDTPQLATTPAVPRQPPAAQQSSRETPAQASVARPKQQAQGSKAATSRGTGQADETTGNTNTQASLLKRWGAQIKSRIERQKRSAGKTGKVRLSLTVHTTGQLRSVSVVQSSGSSLVDNAAVAAVQRARPPRAPRGLDERTYSFMISISFAS